MEKIFITGVSKGLGAFMTKNFLKNVSAKVYGISRTSPEDLKNSPNFFWKKLDLAKPEMISQAINNLISDVQLDLIILNVGVWEKQAFSDVYTFESASFEELDQLVRINITGSLEVLRCLLRNNSIRSGAKIIIIGSTWGLDNSGGKEVVFSACKFAMRGMVHSLRESLRSKKIGISILNLGFLSSDYSEKVTDEYIPLEDVWKAIEFIRSVSSNTCVKEIDMPAMGDQEV
jgi:3-oxoacyl-[acyl-carrier protein] reductase